jgi:hypothetical protein
LRKLTVLNLCRASTLEAGLDRHGSRRDISADFCRSFAIAREFRQSAARRWRLIRRCASNLIGTSSTKRCRPRLARCCHSGWSRAAAPDWRAATYSILRLTRHGLIALGFIIVASLPWSYRLITDPHVGGPVVGSISLRSQVAGISSFWQVAVAAGSSAGGDATISTLARCDRKQRDFSRKRGPKMAVLSLLVHVTGRGDRHGAWCNHRAPVQFSPDFHSFRLSC